MADGESHRGVRALMACLFWALVSTHPRSTLVREEGESRSSQVRLILFSVHYDEKHGRTGPSTTRTCSNIQV